ncbi:MAG: hypothetical protein HRT71_05510 [Flavobacteriales bacterium]|nr:hypothetical protein [Flavobacteriales bacterium]
MKFGYLVLFVLIFGGCHQQARRVYIPDNEMLKAIVDSAGVEQLSLLDEGILLPPFKADNFLRSPKHRQDFPHQFRKIDADTIWSGLLMSLAKDTTDFVHDIKTMEGLGIKRIQRQDLEQWYNGNGKLNWGTFRQNSKTPHGFYQVSRVSVSKDKTKAVAIFSIFREEDIFASMFIMMEARDKRWLVADVIRIW